MKCLDSFVVYVKAYYVFSSYTILVYREVGGKEKRFSANGAPPSPWPIWWRIGSPRCAASIGYAVQRN